MPSWMPVPIRPRTTHANGTHRCPGAGVSGYKIHTGPADAARQEQRSQPALVQPGGRHGATELLQGARSALVRLGEREDGLRVDRHLRLGTLEAMQFHQLVVVEDDPVVDADDGAVADRVVVGLDPRVTLRVVTDVDQGLCHALGELHLLEQGAGAGALLVDRDGACPAPVRVPDRVGTALGDPELTAVAKTSRKAKDAAIASAARCLRTNFLNL